MQIWQRVISRTGQIKNPPRKLSHITKWARGLSYQDDASLNLICHRRRQGGTQGTFPPPEIEKIVVEK